MEFEFDKKRYPIWKETKEKCHRSQARNLLKMNKKDFDNLTKENNIVVHHIDENKTNFKKNNLAILTKEDHNEWHGKE